MNNPFVPVLALYQQMVIPGRKLFTCSCILAWFNTAACVQWGLRDPPITAGVLACLEQISFHPTPETTEEALWPWDKHQID